MIIIGTPRDRENLRRVIDAHIPSITDEIEDDLSRRRDDYDYDTADLALRVCRCGKEIDGFYEYVDHLKEVLGLT